MKGALIIGIDDYAGKNNLHGCVNDAVALSALLEYNGDGSKNFFTDVMKNVDTRAEIRSKIIKLFNADLNTALFYFAGHGCVNERGGFMVTPDTQQFDEGILMDEILNVANKSKIKDKVIIIDCCHAGAFGNPAIVGGSVSNLGEGITILAASRQDEGAVEKDGHGIFTSLLLDALEGGAADIAGNITMGSIYAFIDRSMGFLEQRPQFKTNVSRFLSIRTIQPNIPVIETLKKITRYFKSPGEKFQLDRTYEDTNPEAIPENVAVFKNLQKMQSVGLVVPVDAPYMYFAAQDSKSCELTHLGRHYWKLVRENKI